MLTLELYESHYRAAWRHSTVVMISSIYSLSAQHMNLIYITSKQYTDKIEDLKHDCYSTFLPI